MGSADGEGTRFRPVASSWTIAYAKSLAIWLGASAQVLPEAVAATRRPALAAVALETPLVPMGTSGEVRGWISTAPFENNLTYRVYSEGDAVIGEGWIMVEVDRVDRPVT